MIAFLLFLIAGMLIVSNLDAFVALLFLLAVGAVALVVIVAIVALGVAIFGA